jgi:hypothetical protein
MTVRIGRRPLGRAIATSCGAGVLYGSWAAIANRDHGAQAALRAAATQAIVSVTLTFGVVLIMETLSRRGRSPRHGFAISAVATTSLMIALTVCAHAWSGTPHLIASVAPSVLIGTAFIVTYSRALWILRTKATNPTTGAAG